MDGAGSKQSLSPCSVGAVFFLVANLRNARVRVLWACVFSSIDSVFFPTTPLPPQLCCLCHSHRPLTLTWHRLNSCWRTFPFASFFDWQVSLPTGTHSAGGVVPAGALSSYTGRLMSSRSFKSVRDVAKAFNKLLPSNIQNVNAKIDEYARGE